MKRRKISQKLQQLPPAPVTVGSSIGPSPVVVRHFNLVFALLLFVLSTVIGTLIFLLTRPEIAEAIKNWVAQADGKELPPVETTQAPAVVEETINKKSVSLKFALIMIGGLALFGMFAMYFVVVHVRAQGKKEDTVDATFARRHAYLLGELLLSMSPAVLLIILSILMAYLRMPGLSVVLIAFSSLLLIGVTGFLTVRRHWGKASKFTRVFLAAIPVLVMIIGSVLAYTQNEITIGNTLLIVAVAWLFFIGGLVYVHLMVKEESERRQIDMITTLDYAKLGVYLYNDPKSFFHDLFAGKIALSGAAQPETQPDLDDSEEPSYLEVAVDKLDQLQEGVISGLESLQETAGQKVNGFLQSLSDAVTSLTTPNQDDSSSVVSGLGEGDSVYGNDD